MAFGRGLRRSKNEVPLVHAFLWDYTEWTDLEVMDNMWVLLGRLDIALSLYIGMREIIHTWQRIKARL